MKPIRPAILVVLLAAAACSRGDLQSRDPSARAAAVRGLRPGRDLPALLVAQSDTSADVRAAAARAFATAPGPDSAEALGRLALDSDASVAVAAAEGLGAMHDVPQARAALLAAFGAAGPAGRTAIAAALRQMGVSLREAVEIEARVLWERNVAALGGRGPARLGAAEEVGASQRTEAVQRLLPLADPARASDPEMLAAAALGLGEAGDWSARGPLEDLLASPHAGVPEAAAAALGRLGDPGAADALAAAASEGSSRLAGAAVDALVTLPDATEVGLALCEVAIRAVDPGVAVRAARGAAAREASCPTRPLVQRLGREGTGPALAALAELAPQGAAAQGAVERVVRLLDPPVDPSVRALAARAAARLGGSAAATGVARRLAAAALRVAELRARWVPGRLADTPAPGFQGEEGGDGRVRAVLARAKPLTATPGDAGPAWLDPIPEPEAEELGALLGAAGALSAPGAGDLLKRHLADPAPAVRAGAVSGLAALVADSSEVRAALADPDLDVRLAAAAALGRRADAAAALAAAARTAAEPEWRVALARALGEAGGASAVPPLAALLEDPAAAEAAASSLARIGSQEAASALAAALPRVGGASRVHVVEALNQLTAREAGAAIAGCLVDDRPDVRAAAARAVGKMRLEETSATLEALRSDYYGRVRKAAVEAIAKLPSGAPRARP